MMVLLWKNSTFTMSGLRSKIMTLMYAHDLVNFPVNRSIDHGQSAVRQSVPPRITNALPLQQYVVIDTDDPDVPLVVSVM